MATLLVGAVIAYGASLQLASWYVTRDMTERRIKLHVDVTPENAPAAIWLPFTRPIASVYNAACWWGFSP